MKRTTIIQSAIGIVVALVALVAFAHESRAEDLCSVWKDEITPVVTEREGGGTDMQRVTISFDLPGLIDCRDPYFCIPHNFESAVYVRNEEEEHSWEECERVSRYTHFDCPTNATEEYRIDLAFNSDLTDVRGSTLLGGQDVYFGNRIERDDCRQILFVDVDDAVKEFETTIDVQLGDRPELTLDDDEEYLTLRVNPDIIQPQLVHPDLFEEEEEEAYGIELESVEGDSDTNDAFTAGEGFLSDSGSCSLAGGTAANPLAFLLILTGLAPLVFSRRRNA